MLSLSVCCIFASRSLVMTSNSGDSSASALTSVPAGSQLLWLSLLFTDSRTTVVDLESESESYVTTDGQSASLSWHKAPIWGLRPDFYYCQAVAGLLMWDGLSNERTGMSFIFAAGPRQRSHSRVQVPWDLWTYFYCLWLESSFSSPPTTRRVTVVVFGPACKWVLCRSSKSVSVITSWHGLHTKHRSFYSNCFRGNLFVKALLSNGCVCMLIKNMFPNSGYCCVVCFGVVT
jgi:hypothetical protein